MAVTWIEIRNVRAVLETALEPAAGTNLLVGDNGSGKTSVLEAFYLLGAGRSFASPRLENVVRHGCDALRVVARVAEAGRESVVGVERRLGTAPEIHLDGRKVDGFARLAERLPTQVIYPQSDELIIGGPANRRRFVDWGTFHVEQDFMACWRDYQRALNQRNAALRTAATLADLAPWDQILDRTGAQLAGYREAYVQALIPYVTALSGRLFPDSAIELQMSRGWAAEQPLREALARAFDRDRRTQATNVGPHRAELRIRYGGHEARTTASRGQQKLVVYALKLAQLEHLWRTRQRRALLLLDDLPSELDLASRARVFDALRDHAGQVVITAIERSQLDPLLKGCPVKVFHVERGAVTELV